MSDFFEFSKALPDQVTTERLQEARTTVALVGELDPSSIDSITLAERLRGLSSAISDIVLSRGIVEVTDLSNGPLFDPEKMPAIDASNILRHFDNPDTRLGRMFAAQPSLGHGANMSVREMGKERGEGIYEVHLPTDQMIDEILAQEPVLHDNESVRSIDYRSGRFVPAYPFHSLLYDETAPTRYLSTLQELSVELLDVSA